MHVRASVCVSVVEFLGGYAMLASTASVRYHLVLVGAFVSVSGWWMRATHALPASVRYQFAAGRHADPRLVPVTAPMTANLDVADSVVAPWRGGETEE